MHICLISGPIASGKSAVSSALVDRFRFMSIRSSVYLRGVLQSHGVDISRRRLQELGDRLDVETNYKWLVDSVALSQMSDMEQQKRWLLDSVRKPKQIEHFRMTFPKNVWHVHITAPELILERRYRQRQQGHQIDLQYRDAINHDNERTARRLITLADLVVDTQANSAEQIADAISKFLGLEADAKAGNN